MSIRSLCSLLLAALLAGCMAPQVSIPAGVACTLYGDAREMYGSTRVLIAQGCKEGKLEQDTCAALKQAEIRLKALDEAIRPALQNPEQPVDWAQVSRLVKLAIEIGGLAAGVPIGP